MKKNSTRNIRQAYDKSYDTVMFIQILIFYPKLLVIVWRRS